MKSTKWRSKIKAIVILCIVTLLVLAIWLLLTANIDIDTETETIEVGESYHDTSRSEATLLGMNAAKILKTTGSVDTNRTGCYIITYRPILSMTKYEKNVKVVDTQKPVLQLNGDTIIYMEEIDSYKELGFWAVDNYDGNITDKVETRVFEFEDGNKEILYSVKDSSGNIELVTRALREYTGVVYLTFDDGPSLANTPQILDILNKKNVKATFFVIGYSKNEMSIIERIVKEGHTIGLHGMSHEYSEVYQSVDKVMENFYELQDLVKRTTHGYTSKFIRFPGGASNTISKRYCEGVMTEATERATEEGYTYFDWNVDSGDSSGSKTADEIFKNVVNGIRPDANNVVLLHDAASKGTTVLALERIIDYCIENDYCFKAIDIYTKPVQHNVAN